MTESRRSFIKKTALAGGALSLTHPIWSNAQKTSTTPPPICYFTKHLQWLDFEDLAIAIREAGFDGADLTVRPGGHIEPEQAGKALPKAVAALANKGLKIPMVVSGIKKATDAGIDDYLRALSDNGVKYYRLGYLDYDHKKSIEQNIIAFRDTFRALAEKNAKHKLCGVYQNHAGTRLGASIWDLYLSIQDIDANLIGCQFDVRHATYEGSRSWENDFRCIKNHVRTVVVKDFYWEKDDNGKWKHHNVLMGKGMVDFDTFFQLYHSFNIPGPITNHSEYALLTEEEQKLSKMEKMKIAISRLKQDVDFTKRYLN